MNKTKSPKFSKKTWIIIIAGIILAVLIYTVNSSSNSISVIMSTAKKENIKSYITQRAKTDLPQIYKITIPYNSRILAITKTPGTVVKKGEIVASLDTADIQTQVKIAESNVESIQGKITLNEYRNFAGTALIESQKWIKTMKQILGITKIKITASQHVFEYALQHKNALIQSGRAVSRIEKNQAEMEAAVKEVDLQSAKMTYSAMGFFTEICELAPIYIKEYLNAENIEKDVLKSELKKEQSILALAKKHLKMAKMKSPVDGTILKRYITNERFLPIGTEIMSIGVMKDLEVSVDVLTTEVTEINIGNTVDVYSGAIGSKAISGKVSKIEPQGFTDISSLGVKQQKVKVKISLTPDTLKNLKKEGKNLGVNYRVFVKIYTAEAKNALVIPRTALFRGSNNHWNIFIIKNGQAGLRTVSVGILNDTSAQITAGLNIGDKVIIAPPTSLQSGTKVNIL
jgi:HlyD family secretion protein